MDNEPNDGYGTLVRGTVVAAPLAFSALIGERNIVFVNPEELPGFPHFLVHVQDTLYSSAFGRYQVTFDTAATFNATDMSPRGQDDTAIRIMQSLDMVSPAMAGNLQQAMWNGNTTWASLPDSPYGQPTMTMPQAQSVFDSALHTLRDCQ